MQKIEKQNNQYSTSFNYNIEGFLRQIDINHEKNIYNVEIVYGSEYAEELKRKVLINIAKNKILQNIHPGFEKQVFLLHYLSINSENHRRINMVLFPNLSLTLLRLSCPKWKAKNN